MPAAQMNPSWLQSRQASDAAADNSKEPERLWRSFLGARAVLGLILVALHSGILMQLVSRQALINTALSGIYFLVCIAARVWFKPKPLSHHFDSVWALTIGIDVLIFTTMQITPGVGVNYAPLFALPVFMAAVLGSNRMGLGTSALITLALFTGEAWNSATSPAGMSDKLLQASLIGAGCFIVAFISSQFAAKWVASEREAESSRRDALMQQQVNALVVESLGEGIMVVDQLGLVRTINPAAAQLIGFSTSDPTRTLRLDHRPRWRPLMALLRASFKEPLPRATEVELLEDGHVLRRLLIETRMTSAAEEPSARLCVMVVKDFWALRARIQTEKLASMGRMSAALAHEIRNPLTAIIQANELLQEDLQNVTAQRLTNIVHQNASRLGGIVRDVLELSQAPQANRVRTTQALQLEAFVMSVCEEWRRQNGVEQQLALAALSRSKATVQFDADHLRRVLVNLLDNAWRYASQEASCIEVFTSREHTVRPGLVELHVWSDGTPITSDVEQHLFEPFFTSENRSTGLGLYICRELCERNQTSLSFRRGNPPGRGSVWGKDFVLTMALRAQQGIQADQASQLV